MSLNLLFFLLEASLTQLFIFFHNLSQNGIIICSSFNKKFSFLTLKLTLHDQGEEKYKSAARPSKKAVNAPIFYISYIWYDLMENHKKKSWCSRRFWGFFINISPLSITFFLTFFCSNSCPKGLIQKENVFYQHLVPQCNI